MLLQSARPQREYPCSQPDLYTIVETGWSSYAQYLVKFENHSTNYSAATGTDQIAAVADARAMPDEDSRTEVHKTLRVQLKSLADACLVSWSNMGTYIRDGFPEDEFENKRIAAGYNSYRSASRDDWDAVKTLMQSGLLFLNANAVVLTDDGGMPAHYMPNYIAAKDAFELKYQAFLQAEELTKVLTDEKILADNALHHTHMKMLEDGKKIFRDNAAIREQFTFDRIWTLVNGSNPTSKPVPARDIELGLFAYDEVTGAPIQGARLTIFNAPGGLTISATTNVEGMLFMIISGFEPNGEVLLQGELFAEGYELEMGDVETTAGKFYSIDAGMVPVM